MVFDLPSTLQLEVIWRSHQCLGKRVWCWKYEAIVGLVELQTDDGQTGAWPEGHHQPFINHHHVGGQWVASGWPVGGQWVASGPPVTSHHGDHCFSFAGTIAGNKEVETLLPQGLLETATDSGSK